MGQCECSTKPNHLLVRMLTVRFTTQFKARYGTVGGAVSSTLVTAGGAVLVGVTSIGVGSGPAAGLAGVVVETTAAAAAVLAGVAPTALDEVELLELALVLEAEVAGAEADAELAAAVGVDAGLRTDGHQQNARQLSVGRTHIHTHTHTHSTRAQGTSERTGRQSRHRQFIRKAGFAQDVNQLMQIKRLRVRI